MALFGNNYQTYITVPAMLTTGDRPSSFIVYLLLHIFCQILSHISPNRLRRIGNGRDRVGKLSNESGFTLSPCCEKLGRWSSATECFSKLGLIGA